MKFDSAKTLMRSLELDPKDFEMFFCMLSSISGTSKVDINCFVDGCMYVRGPAASLDVQCLRFEVSLIRAHLMKYIESQLGYMPSEQVSARQTPTHRQQLENMQ